MPSLLRKCDKCNNYTLNTVSCPYCSAGVHVPNPPKFSPDDKYLKYRMALKRRAKGSEENIHQRIDQS